MGKESQRLHRLHVIDRAREDDLIIGRIKDTLMIRISIRLILLEQQPPHLHVVLGMPQSRFASKFPR